MIGPIYDELRCVLPDAQDTAARMFNDSLDINIL